MTVEICIKCKRWMLNYRNKCFCVLFHSPVRLFAGTRWHLTMVNVCLCVSEKRAESFVGFFFVFVLLAHVYLWITWVTRPEIAQQLRKKSYKTVSASQITLSQSLPDCQTKQKWIRSLNWSEQQIGEMNPNNHRYLFRGRGWCLLVRKRPQCWERLICVGTCSQKNKSINVFLACW